MAILRSLKAVGDLVIDSIYKRDDGYWDFEENEHEQTRQALICSALLISTTTWPEEQRMDWSIHLRIGTKRFMWSLATSYRTGKSESAVVK
jgi:hypothetical protein